MQQGDTPGLRPLGVGEIIDVAIKVYTRNLATFIGIVAIVFVPLGIVTTLAYLSLIPDGAFIRDNSLYFPVNESTGTYNAIQIAISFVGSLFSLLATAAGTKAVVDAYLGRKPTIGGSFAYIGRRFHSVLWVVFLFGLAVVVSVIGIILPIYVAVAFSVAVPVLVVEGERGTNALRRSHSLVKGRWWPTFGAILLGWLLIPFVIQFAIGFVLGIGLVVQGSDDPTTYLVLLQTVGTIAQIIAVPIQITVITIIYFDLRVRKEAFDLQLLAERIGSGPGSESSSGSLPASSTTPPPDVPPPSG